MATSLPGRSWDRMRWRVCKGYKVFAYVFCSLVGVFFFIFMFPKILIRLAFYDTNTTYPQYPGGDMLGGRGCAQPALPDGYDIMTIFVSLAGMAMIGVGLAHT